MIYQADLNDHLNRLSPDEAYDLIADIIARQNLSGPHKTITSVEDMDPIDVLMVIDTVISLHKQLKKELYDRQRTGTHDGQSIG